MPIKPYLQVTKPGIVMGNLVSVAGGFFLATRGPVNGWLLLATLVGVGLIIASGCVFNNYIDRDIDRKMVRTQNRPLVLGLIPVPVALAYAAALLVAGVAVLALATNMLSVGLVLAGFAIYVGAYSLYLKRNSVYGTLVGSFSGAVPPVVGYCAVSNQFDLAALILLLMFSLWQMPHSYAIAIFRFQDYQAAQIPVLPLRRGIEVARRHILAYIIVFTLVASLLSVLHYAGVAYGVVVVGLGAWWFWEALAANYRTQPERWARKVFTLSILIITLLSVMMSIGY